MRPTLGDLGVTYDDHIRLIGKRIMDFLLALIELFSLGVTTEALRAIIGSKSAILLQRGPVDPNFQVEGVAPHQPFFFSENWAKCSFVRYINLDRSFYCFVTIHECDRQTDRQTDGQMDRILITIPRLHYMHRGKNEVYKSGYRRRSCTSKTAKIHHFVRLVMYCCFTTVPVAFY